VTSIGEGRIVRYKSDGCWQRRLSADPCMYCGYGVLYAVAQYMLSRELKVPVGKFGETTSREFSFVYGHILDRPYPGSPSEESTGWGISDGEIDIPIARGETVGYVAPDGTDNCGSDDYNGDGAEHLHCGTTPDTRSVLAGYGLDAGYSPAHLVIAASRVGVFERQDGSGEGVWQESPSDAIFEKWWGFMELEHYHNKLGRPNNNHWDQSQGTDFVHYWQNTYTDPLSEGVWVQDFLQPYRGKNVVGEEDLSYFGTDGQTAIILNEEGPAPRAFVVREGFWGFYKQHEGYRNLGAPVGDEYKPEDYYIIPFGQVVARQDFERGFLAWDGSEGGDYRIWAFNLDESTKPLHSVTIRVVDSPAGSPKPVGFPGVQKPLAGDPATEIWHEGVLLGETPLTMDGCESFGYAMVARTLGQEDRAFEFTVGEDDMEVVLDLAAPVILERTPDVGAVDVPVTTSVVITFSVKMEMSTTQNAVAMERGAGSDDWVNVSKTWLDGGRTITLTPTENLAYGAEYQVVVMDYAQALDGEPFGGALWVFQTMDAPLASIALSVEALDFGEVRIREQAERSVTVSNAGNATLNVTEIMVSGPDAEVYSVAEGVPFQVAPGEAHVLSVQFAPSDVGIATATLSLLHNAESGLSDVMLSGTGLAAGTGLIITQLMADIGDEFQLGPYEATKEVGVLAVYAVDVPSDNYRFVFEVNGQHTPQSEGEKNCLLVVDLGPGHYVVMATVYVEGDSASAEIEFDILAGPCTAPNAPVVEPCPNISREPFNTTLRWNLVDGASTYVVECADNEEFIGSQTESGIVDTMYSMDPLLIGRAYWWRVKAVGADGAESAFSEPDSFTVTPGLSTWAVMMTAVCMITLASVVSRGRRTSAV